MAKWASIGAPIDAAAFHASYDAVQAKLGIARIEPRSGRHNGPHLIEGWRAYAAASGRPRDTRAITDWFAKNFGPPNATPTTTPTATTPNTTTTQPTKPNPKSITPTTPSPKINPTT